MLPCDTVSLSHTQFVFQEFGRNYYLNLLRYETHTIDKNHKGETETAS